MEVLWISFWFIMLSPLLPFVALVGTGLTVLFLQLLGALAYESL
jgi:hypothetical protein